MSIDSFADTFLAALERLLRGKVGHAPGRAPSPVNFDRVKEAVLAGRRATTLLLLPRVDASDLGAGRIVRFGPNGERFALTARLCTHHSRPLLTCTPGLPPSKQSPGISVRLIFILPPRAPLFSSSSGRRGGKDTTVATAAGAEQRDAARPRDGVCVVVGGGRAERRGRVQNR